LNYKDRKNKPALIKHKDDNLKKLDALITLGIESSSNEDYKRSALLSYWLEDFNKYLTWEKSFNPKKLKRYERGDIIKVNLGFNLGSEQGGMRYAVVLDNKNALSRGVLTIIPLASKKAGEPVHPNDVDLGNDIYSKMKLKFSEKKKALIQSIAEMKNVFTILEKAKESSLDDDSIDAQLSSYEDKIKLATKELHTFQKIEKELSQMKAGSIGLVDQITTISKMRIFDPRNTGGVLDGIKLSPANLDLLNNKITELFLG